MNANFRFKKLCMLRFFRVYPMVVHDKMQTATCDCHRPPWLIKSVKCQRRNLTVIYEVGSHSMLQVTDTELQMVKLTSTVMKEGKNVELSVV